MTDSPERPKFWPSFYSALAKKAEKGEVWKFFVVPFVATTVAVAATYFIPNTFWSNEKQEVAVAFYTGILTVNGLILALSWSAFSRIHEIICEPAFCAFLRRNKLLNNYITNISFVHALQIAAILFSAIPLVVILIDVPYLMVDQLLFGLMVAISIVAVKEAANIVGVMNDLLWQKSYFDANYDPSKIVSMERSSNGEK